MLTPLTETLTPVINIFLFEVFEVQQLGARLAMVMMNTNIDREAYEYFNISLKCKLSFHQNLIIH